MARDCPSAWGPCSLWVVVEQGCPVAPEHSDVWVPQQPQDAPQPAACPQEL